MSNALHKRRRSIRLPGYDYSAAGEYFVTISAHERRCLFAQVVQGEVWLNALGDIVRQEWVKTAVIRPYIQLDEYVVMPNHFHGILVIGDGRTARLPLRVANSESRFESLCRRLSGPSSLP